MYLRHIFEMLQQHLDNKLITVVTGLRRIGKSYALKHLLSTISSENKIYLDLEKAENRYIFNQAHYKDVVISLEIEGIDFSRKAYIALDELQLVPNITSVIKYLYDTYDIKFLITGSSSFYLKNHFNESLAGRKTIFEMKPLSFQEFLWFKEVNFDLTKYAFSEINISLYQKLNVYYREYLTYGGFPEVVLHAKTEKDKISYLKEIVNAYLQMDLLIAGDITKTDEIYSLIRLLSKRIGSKTDLSKLSSVTGISRYKLKEYITFLEYTYFIVQVPAYVQNIDREISLLKKLYFADNGLLTVFGINDTGALLENSIANQLLFNGDVKYYAKKSGQEIDFILNEQIAIEVKETAAIQDLKKLESRAKSIGITNTTLVALNFNNHADVKYTWAGNVYIA